jgi:SRSO17 transposase
MGERFCSLCRRFSHFFQVKTRNSSRQSEQYLKGLMQVSRKNMERMAEVVPDCNDQALQHFISNSKWDYRAVIDQVALKVSGLFTDPSNTALLIDESGFEKKGKKSVGVDRQWNGRLGKVENSQVGVFASLVNGVRATLIDVRLFLNKAWVQDKARASAAKIPDEKLVNKSKAELALDMIRHNRQLGVEFSWVGADALYGKDPRFLRSLDDDGEVFVVDVHKNQHIYLEDPEPMMPESKQGRGRKPKQRVAQTKSVRVDKWLGEQPEHKWSLVTLRDSTRGKLQVEILHRHVWLWDKREEKARHWHLLVRREVDSTKEITFSLSNAPKDVSKHRLARMQGQRFWIERAFQDGKSNAGLGDYQVRSWTAWHHHMAMVMIAMLFMLEERIEMQDDHPLLSSSDIEFLLARFLPRRDVTQEEVIRLIKVRHQRRLLAIEAARRKQIWQQQFR